MRSTPLLFVFLLSAAFLAGCASTLPSWSDRPTSPSAEATSASADEILARSIEAHGGDLRAQRRDIAVSYEGEWGRIIRRLQPILVDYDYRHGSQERLLVDGERVFIAQSHQGPDGVKHVVRDAAAGVTKVWYDGVPSDDPDVGSASALVADAYAMFLLGPSYFRRPGVELRVVTPARENGITYERILARLRPGFGDADEDLAVLWIDPDSHHLFRVHFTLEGTPQTRGADVDVTFSKYRSVDGHLVPTDFYERVRSPVRTFAHHWWLTGLDFDRGMTRAELDRPYLDGVAKLPAASGPASVGRAANAKNAEFREITSSESAPIGESSSRLRSVRGP